MAITDDEIAKIARAVWAFDPGWQDPSDHSKGVWPGVSDETYPDGPSKNGTVAPGTALGTLLDRQQGYGDSTRASLAVITATLTAIQTAVVSLTGVDTQALAAAIVAMLPPIIVPGTLTIDNVETAVRNVLHNA